MVQYMTTRLDTSFAALSDATRRGVLEQLGRADASITELAEKFLKFMVSPAFQNAIPAGNWMYPVTNVALPAGFEQLTKPKTSLEFTPQQVAAQRAAWVSEWQRAVSR